MATPYVGEIKMFGGNFAPRDYAFCQGQQVAISQNEALYNLIGTTYGGDGVQTFNLPNMASRVPVHQGQGTGLTTRVIGEMAGTETVTLTTQQIPSHTHSANCNSASTTTTQTPASNVWAQVVDVGYTTTAANNTMSPTALGQAGGSQPHENMLPYVGITYVIALFGVYPSQN